MLFATYPWKLVALSFTHPTVQVDERLYVRGRLVLNAALFGLVGFTLPSQPASRWTSLLLLAAVSLGTLYVMLASRRGTVATAMVRILAVDIFAVGGFTFVFREIEDGFYPAVVLLVIVYALVVKKREAWLVGGAAAVCYAIGYTWGRTIEVADFLQFSFKTMSVALFGILVASTVERQREREEETRKAVAERDLLNEVLQRRISELQAVSQITETVHSSLDFDRVGPIVLDILAKAIGVETCCLFVIDKERSDTLFSASVGLTGGLDEHYHLSLSVAEDHFSCVTVFDHQEVMVLFCASAEDVERLTEEDRLVLGAVASELVVAVENSRLYKLTKTLAVTDELTGLNNYRFLQQKLDEEIERCRRYGKRLSLLMIDVDDFKRFNDTQGHIAGDAALADLGSVMTSVVREVDTVARYGGEEFSVVLPETDAAGAFVAAEKIREAVATHSFADASGVRSASMSVSVGLATFPTHAWDKESLLREADDALYNAKHGGKNRVRAPLRRPENGSAEGNDPPNASAVADLQDEWTERT